MKTTITLLTEHVDFLDMERRTANCSRSTYVEMLLQKLQSGFLSLGEKNRSGVIHNHNSASTKNDE